MSGAKHDAHPWEPFLRGRMGRSNLLLFRLGDDEGSTRAMFFPTAPHDLIAPQSRFSAVLAIQTYYWFDFTGFPADPAPLANSRSNLMRSFSTRRSSSPQTTSRS